MQFVFHALVRCAAILADQVLIDNGGHEINHPRENIVEQRPFRRSDIPTKVYELEVTPQKLSQLVQPDRLPVIRQPEGVAESCLELLCVSQLHEQISPPLVHGHSEEEHFHCDQDVSNPCRPTQLSSSRRRLCVALSVR